MKNKFHLAAIIFLSCILINGASNAQSPVFNSVTPNNTSIQKFEKFELNINLTAGYTNPYDYSDIAVRCIFISPSNKKDTVDGFYMQDYTLNTGNGNITANGTGSFRVRFSPNETGTWQYVLSCTNTVGTATQPSQTFDCTSSAGTGFIRKNSTDYLNFDDGSQYIPVGEDMGWQDNNPYLDYTNWLGKLSSNNGNFIRVWMADWSFGLEWLNGDNNFSGLKKYKQTSAYYLDWLLDECEQKGVYIMLTLNHHGQVSTTTDAEWNSNPYNSANGGPCTNTWDFFSNATAIADIKNRLRYIVARYGYSKNIMSWELFNEVEWTDNFTTYKTQITSWLDQMANYIKSKDVNRHLVTTSYANDYNDPNTWNLSGIDFTQTHYYVSSPNLESILSGGDKNYLTQFSKPTLNGEFGLGGDGSALATTDPDGVYIHNAIWGSMFGGGMGSAMSWWWDNYIDPQNLYYHFKPLSGFVSSLKMVDDNYKTTAATISGGGVSDLSISPGTGFSKAPASAFTIDASGNISPAASELSTYLFGNIYNTQYRNPPTFTVNYPVAGQFKVVTTSNQSGTTSPQINIYLDGVELLNQSGAASTTYSINVPAGNHTIKVDNLGTDWLNISNYIFTNIGSALSNYVLKSAAATKVAGWLLNNQYNWQYLQNNGNTLPSAVSGASVIIPAIQNGTYNISFYSCSTGLATGSSVVIVTNGTLTIPLPNISWDIAFTAVNQSALAIILSNFYGESLDGKNNLFIEIANAANVKSVEIERSANSFSFTTIGALDAAKGLIGKHIFTDDKPLNGNNYYRLKITDNDGSSGESNIVLLKNNNLKIAFYPNPVKDILSVNIAGISAGKYNISVTNLAGKILKSGSYNFTGTNQLLAVPFAQYAPGVYFIKIFDEEKNIIAQQKVVK